MVTTHRRHRLQQHTGHQPTNSSPPLVSSTERDTRKTQTAIRRRPNALVTLMVVSPFLVVLIWLLSAVRVYLLPSPPLLSSQKTGGLPVQRLDTQTMFSRHKRDYPALRGNIPSKDSVFEAWKQSHHATNFSKEVDRQMHFVFGLWDSDADTQTGSSKSTNIISKMPLSFQRNLQVYQAQNPEWTIHTWFSKTEIEHVVELWTVPDLDPFESSFDQETRQKIRHAWAVARPVQQADLFRYLLLHQFGGFYFDLDVVTSGNNTVDFFMDQVGLNPSMHTAALFWEMGRLTPQEQAKSSKDVVRRGLPEYRTRLSNYCLWSQPRSNLTKCAIKLASSRIVDVQQRFNFTTVEQRIPATLYSSGPDVVTECAFGVRRYDDLDGTAIVSPIKEDEEEVVKNQMTKEKVLVVDPGPNLVNGNTFSWRNRLAA